MAIAGVRPRQPRGKRSGAGAPQSSKKLSTFTVMPGGSRPSGPEPTIRVSMLPSSRPRVVDHASVLHLDDQVVAHGRQPEIVVELGAGIERLRRRRSHLHDDDRVDDLDTRRVEWNSAADQAIGLIGGRRSTRTAGPSLKARQRDACCRAWPPARRVPDGVLGFSVARRAPAPSRRLRRRRARSACLRLLHRPGDELVGVHAQLVSAVIGDSGGPA